MNKSRYTAEQMTFALGKAEEGAPVLEVCRKIGIAEQTFYRWKTRFLGMGDLVRLVSQSRLQGPPKLKCSIAGPQ